MKIITAVLSLSIVAGTVAEAHTVTRNYTVSWTQNCGPWYAPSSKQQTVVEYHTATYDDKPDGSGHYQSSDTVTRTVYGQCQ